MSYSFSSLVLLLLAWISFTSCDDAIAPDDFNADKPFVQNLTIDPTSINFDTIADGQKDTTLNIRLTTQGVNFPQGQKPFYSVFINGEGLPSIQGEFKAFISNLTTSAFEADIEIQTNTIDFNSYTFIVTPTLDGDDQNYSQAVLHQTGVPINAPEILEVNNPDTIFRPTSGEELAFFTAKVKDVDGQNNIDRVLIRIIDQEVGEATGSPFEMFDDGSSNNDITPNDTVFTFSLPVTQTNNRPNRDFDIEYFAIDKSGLSSDTVRTIFRIRE